MKDFVFKALVALVFTLGTYYSSGAVIGFGLLAVFAVIFLVEFCLPIFRKEKWGNPDRRPKVCTRGEMENALGHIQKVGARMLQSNKL